MLITNRLSQCFFIRYQFGLSFWRHPFSAENPFVSKWCNTKFLQICSDKETNSSWKAWGLVHFQQILIFAWTIPLTSLLSHRWTFAIISQSMVWLHIHILNQTVLYITLETALGRTCHWPTTLSRSLHHKKVGIWLCLALNYLINAFWGGV